MINKAMIEELRTGPLFSRLTGEQLERVARHALRIGLDEGQLLHQNPPTAGTTAASPVAVTLETAVGRRSGCVPGGAWKGTTRRNSPLLQRVVTQSGAARCVHWVA
jgi:hypothetical protein